MKTDLFPNATPESMGISSKSILKFLKKLEKNGTMVHSVLMMRRGHVVTEGYYAPFTQDGLHRKYSVSKSFVGTAVGFLADEGRIKLDDHICDYFKDKLPENPHPYILDMRIRDLLMMSTTYSGTTYKRDDKDWAWTFFNTTPSHPAGTIYSYDTSASYVLGVLVERITGKPFLEYLKDKGLREMGFSEEAWCVKAPEGNSWGGSGVMCTTRDLARLALLYLNKGNIGGKQYLSREYVKAATSRQIDNCTNGHRDYMSGNGYGYQIRLLRDGAYAFCGMGMQLAIIVPKEELVFVCTGDVQGSAQVYAGMFELLWNEIIEELHPDSLPEDKMSARQLEDMLSTLQVVNPLIGKNTSPISEVINGQSYKLYPNPMGIDKISVSFEEEVGLLTLEKKEGNKTISFGLDNYIEGYFPESHYYGDTVGIPKDEMYKCIGVSRWTEENKLVIRCYVIDDYFGNMTITLGFKGKELGLYMSKTAEWFLDEYQGFAGGYLIEEKKISYP